MQKRLMFVREKFPGRLKELSDDVTAYCEAEIEAAKVKPSAGHATKEFREQERKAETKEERAALWKKHQEERGNMAEAFRTIQVKVEKQRALISEKLSRLGKEETAKGEGEL